MNRQEDFLCFGARTILFSLGDMMKIGLLGLDDPGDIQTYSGIPYHLAHYLRRSGNDVSILGPYPVRRLRVQIENRFLRTLTGKQLIHERHPAIVKQYGEIIRNYSSQHPDLDVLLATSAFCLGTSVASVPLVFWGDSTFAGVLDKYDRYFNLSPRTVAQCHAAEQQALTSCDLAIFSSQWAANVAQASYQVDPSKIRVITYGANLLVAPEEHEVGHFIALRSREVINLLLIGAQWERKGVDRAIDTVGALRARGFEAGLRVIGCYPPKGRTVPSYVSLGGKISKATPEGRQQFAAAIGASHLLILPTVAECAAVVLAEASAFGVPVLTTDVGGNASLVCPGENGFLLPVTATSAQWADAVEGVVGKGRALYERAAWRAFRYFHQHLSWERAVNRFELEMRALLSAENQK
jgi:glycosyltransferase involved in cell wall biosynthesis